MKNKIILNLLFAIGCISAQADIVIPGANGTDGALNITADTVIDLSQAPTGTWDQDNSANAGKGVYDPEKWAVVFKYTGINIAAGAKVTFKNNASRAPVVWLVSGDVTIAGTVDLSGESPVKPEFHLGQLPEPGPGGFRGGSSPQGGDVLWAAGFGPGGGQPSNDYRIQNPLNAAYGTIGGNTTNRYGNPSLIPLVGGSGGSGHPSGHSPGAGGAGGGAILIATNNNIQLQSGCSLLSLGGSGIREQWASSGHGSGGGIRLICSGLHGAGTLNTAGGGGGAGSGRVRLERVSTTADLIVAPAPSILDLIDGNSAMIWPGSGEPIAKILSVNSVNAPADPKAAFGSYTPDVALPLVSQVEVIVETVNVESASQVFVRITPRNGMTVAGKAKTEATEVAAVVDQQVSTTPLKLRWKATLPTLMGHSALQARVIRP
jgi:hypothetical protein